MADQHDFETRLSELIWRTVKLRVSVLILSILALLLIWSALITGNKEAQKLDDSSCRFLINQDNDILKSVGDRTNEWLAKREKEPLETHFRKADEYCSGRGSRRWIEVIRSMDLQFPLIATPGLPDDVTAWLGQRPKAFADYDTQRRASYRLNIKLSSEYSESSVEGNTLAVAEIVPFCIFIALTAYFILGFQEDSYRTQSRLLLQTREDEGRETGLVLAETQFFAHPLVAKSSPLTRLLVWSPSRLSQEHCSLPLFYCLRR